MATKRHINESPKQVPQKFQIQQSTTDVQEILKQLSEQLPDNDLVKKLQGAFDGHMECLNQFLSTFETPEEKERKRSLVLIGLPESTDPKASSRVRSDAAAVAEIFDILDMAAQPTTIFRMGHPDPNHFADRPRKGPRILKIVMPSSGLQRQVLSSLKSKRNELRKSARFQRCFIRPSLTPEQREMDKAAHTELKRRKDAGEKKLFIRNFKVYSGDTIDGDF